MEEIEQQNRFIVALTEHRVFGHIITANLIATSINGDFYTVIATVNQFDVEQEPDKFSRVEVELVRLIEKYSDDNLARRFSRGKKTAEFFRTIDEKLFNGHVIPYIDRQIVAILDIIRNHDVGFYVKPAKYSNIHHDDRITVSSEYGKAVFHFHLNESSFRYRLDISHAGKPMKMLDKKPVIIANSPCRMILDNKLYFFEELTGKRLLPFLTKEYINIPLNVTEKYLRTFVYNIVGENEVVAEGFDIINVEQEKKAFIVIEQGLQLEPIIVLVYQYGDKKFKAGRQSQVGVELVKKEGRFIFYKHFRDFDWEREITGFFAERGFELIGDQLQFSLQKGQLDDNPGHATISWVNQYSDDLKQNNIEVRQNLLNNYYTGTFALDIKTRMENDWFDVYAVVKLGDFEMPFIHLKQNILNGRREFILPNGDIAILPLDWFVKLKNLLPFMKGKDEKLRVSKHHYKLLNDSLGVLEPELERAFEQIEPSKFKLCNPPKGLKANLRNYQQVGYSWMQMVTQNNFGACLADDMGLGKTLQTLALILHEKEQADKAIADSRFNEHGLGLLFAEAENRKPASLIVVPTSLIHNWHNEIKKFTPSLKVYRHVGLQRKKTTNISGLINNYDVIITTYGTIRNDYELFRELMFNFIVLDESQNIKNAGSKTYKAVNELKSAHKLVLTGTPIENSLSDLWSQINFLNKGLLGSLKFFKEEYIVPIEKNHDEEKQQHLHKIISPFILRRTKQEVASDLPPLTEQVRYCEMTESQAEIYEKEKSAVRNQLLENFERFGVAKSSFMILQGLTRLRQLSNHPALLKMEGVDSGKFQEVLLSLENLMAENHKVLIFSSFVTHLKLFQNEFDTRGWGYCLLTGQTTNREKVIDDFQNDDSKRLFLISIKAGGVGLNLTSADYIFILDPWWNPAVENQAISRAHRIGQDKKVFVYRFITGGTIEEKIQNLKERKSALAEKFIHSNSPFETTSTEELKELFD